MRAVCVGETCALQNLRKICELSQIICGLIKFFTQKQHPKYMRFNTVFHPQ